MEYRLYTSGGMEYLVYFPLLFIERFGNINRMHNFSLIKFYIQPICIACIFTSTTYGSSIKSCFVKNHTIHSLQFITGSHGQYSYLFGTPHGHSRKHSASKTHSHSPSSPRVHAMARFHYTGSGRWAECRYKSHSKWITTEKNVSSWNRNVPKQN